MNESLLSLIKRKNNLRRRAKGTPRNTAIEAKLRRLTQEVHKQKSKAKRDYYRRLFDRSESPKQTWNCLNEVIGKSKKQVTISCLLDQGVRVTDDKAKATLLNDFFCSRGAKLANEICKYPPRDLNYFNTLHQEPKEFNFMTVTAEELKKNITELNTSKAPGHDGISNTFLVKHCTVLAPFLCLLFNRMIKESRYPDLLKIGKVVPIPKQGGNPELVNGYRPITLLSTIAKLFERIMFCQLEAFYESKCYFYNHQYGFRRGSGTSVATIELVNELQTLVDDGHSPAVVFLDLSAAFDTIDHQILLEKYSRSGLKEDAVALLGSYLCNRK